MTTFISLNNQAFWTPPAPQSAKPRHKHSSEQSQSQEATLAALGPNIPPSHDTVLISSDEESDADDDTDNAEDDGADMADYLPSIPEILAKLEGAERGRVDTTVSSAPVPERMRLADAESRRSSVTSQRSGSAPTSNPPGASAPAAAARYPASDPISPTATVWSESTQPNHGEESRCCKPDHSPVIYENTPQPESEATPTLALYTTLHTTMGPDSYENDLAQPERENESRLASAARALADVATSAFHVITASHEAETPPEEGFGYVIGGMPADPDASVAIPEPIRRRSTRPPKAQPAKRRRRASTTHSVTATSDEEEVPAYKRRRVAASAELVRGTQSALGPVQKPRTRASKQATTYRSTGASLLDEDQATTHADATYQEWPLSDAVLQRIQVNGHATLQLQFTWATPCALHTTPAARPTAQAELPSTRRGRGASTRASKGRTSNSGTGRADSGNTDREADIHIVARVLARWKRGTYFLEWADGSTGWEPKRNILDRQLMDDFEASYRGFDAGIDVLASRTWKGRQQWRVHWHGRPAAEDCWVDGKLMDPARLETVQASGFDNLRE